MATSPEYVPAFTPSPEMPDGYRKVFEDLDLFDHHEGPVTDQERKAFVADVLDALKQVEDGIFFDNVSNLYNAIHESVIIRREDPHTALHAVLERIPIPISFQGKNTSSEEAPEPYFNATRWNGTHGIRGLGNPFIEGFSHVEGVVTVLGFSPGSGITLHPRSPVQEKMTDSTIAHDLDVAVSGTVEPEQVQFMVARIPAHLMPEGSLLPGELDAQEEGKLRHVFRGVLLKRSADSQSLH